MRALAWWHAVPAPPPDAREQHTARRSRMGALPAGDEPFLPEIDQDLRPFVAMLFEAGPTSAAGQGMGVITWQEFEAWQRCTGVALPPWQLRLLRRLSGEYVTEYNQAGAHDAPPPWARERELKPSPQERVRALAKL